MNLKTTNFAGFRLRHTVGLLVATRPCGTVVMFQELYGSESLSQVYGSLIDYLAKLPEHIRKALEILLYDDA